MNGQELIGEVLTHIDMCENQCGEDAIMLTTKSGKKYEIYHSQDCCEQVRIEDTEGNWHDLIGKTLIEVDWEELDYEEASDSGTRTNITFKVDGATVISRWIGESNGWYSETVGLKEITGT